MIKRAFANRLARIIILALLMLGVQLGWDSLPAAASGFQAPPPPTCSAVQTIVGNQGINSQPSMDSTGSHIVFWSTGNLARQNPDGNIEVFLYDDALEPRLRFSQLTHTTGSILGGFNLWPSISGDGTRTALFSDRDLAKQNADGNFEIFVYDSTTHRYQQITQSREGANLSPTISADGYHIAFASDQNYAGANADGNQEIFLANIDALGGVSFIQITRTTKGINDQASISADGSRVAFISNQALAPDGDNADGNFEVFVYDTTARTLKQVTRTVGGANNEPAISADGSRIVFSSDRDLTGENADGNQEIFLATIGATGEISFEQVTETTGVANDQPAIGGRGTRVAYVAGDAVWLYDTVARVHIKVDDGADANSRPSISGDGTFIAYAANRNIYRANCPWSDLSISKSTSTVPLVPGTTVIYTIAVDNDGPSVANGATVVDTVPSALQGVSWTCTATLGSSCGAPNGSGGTIRQTVNLALGGRVTYQVRGTLPSGFQEQELRNEAEVIPPSGLTERDLANNTAVITTTVEAQADLGVSKSVDNVLPNEGETITYTLSVRNYGPSDARGIVLTDTLPSGLTFVSASPAQGSYEDSSGKWTVGNLARNQSAALLLRAKVGVGAGGRDIVNTTDGLSSATRDLNTGNNTGTATLHVNQSPLATADLVAVDEDAVVTFDVLANDTDLDGQIVTTTLSIATLPVHGIAATGLPTTTTFVYTPTLDWNGTDTLRYEICDNSKACSTGIVTITVRPVNDAPVLTPIPRTLTLTEDDIDNSGWLVSDLLGASVSDVDSDLNPGEPKGLALMARNPGNGTWQYQLAGETAWTDVGGVSTSSALLLGEDDRLRLRPDGRNATIASLSYYAWDQSDGRAAGTLADPALRGDTTAFSDASDTATVSVAAVNDAPVLAPSSQMLAPLTEDDINNSGLPVSALLGSTVSDVDSGALEGVALTTADPGNGDWQYQLTGETAWTNFGSVSTSSALLLRATDRLRFHPDGKNGTTASLSYHAWDQSDGRAAGSQTDASSRGGTTAFSQDASTAGVTVSDVNDAPALDTSVSPSLTGITEDQVDNQGNTVAEVVGASISDVDTGAVQGIAVYGLVSSTGVWQYQLAGGSIWTDIGSVFAGNALLLDLDARVRFVPDAKNGTTASLSYYAWDQTTGTVGNKADASSRGGTTAFSSASDTATITVGAVNDAPVLTPSSRLLDPLTEDETENTGLQVSALLSGLVSDDDHGALQGIALYALDAGNGAWQYQLAGESGWTDSGSVPTGSALLLRATDRLRFRPDGRNATSAGFSYYAWDQSDGRAAGTLADPALRGGTTAFSLASSTAGITVSDLNDAPVLAPGGPSLDAISEDIADSSNTGKTVAEIAGGSISDVDTGARQGIAVYELDAVNGVWQYSLDDGNTWTAIGAISSSSALLLDPDTRIRFLPDGRNGTTASFRYYAWDQSSGTADVRVRGGTSAFSELGDRATITVNAVNDAPVLEAGGSPHLTAITEDDTENTGDTVDAFAGAWITDVDSGALKGIALSGLVSGNGVWQYSLDGGSSWTPVPSVSESDALLLRATDRVRFLPDAKNGTTASFSYYAWDQSDGRAAGSQADASSRGGTSAFSLAGDTATINVADLNDAPVLDTSASPSLTAILEDPAGNPGDKVEAILAGVTITDVDLPGLASKALAITAVEASNGTWQYSLTGGSSWTPVPAVSESNVFLLAATSYLRFVPAPDFFGTASLTFRAWDGTGGSAGTLLTIGSPGGTSPVSSASDTATITVGAVNDAPSFTPGSNVSVAEDAGPQDLVWATAISAGPANEASQTLDFQLSNDYSALFSAGPVLDPTTGHLSFTPAPDRFGAATVTVVLQDDGDTANGGVDQSAPVVFALTITPVNDPPVITTSAGSAGYTENDPALAVDPSLTLADVDSPELSGATVQITGNYVKGQDTLAFTNAGGITGVWNAATGVLTLSGSAGLAEYQAALRSVSYVNGSEDPSAAVRTITFTATDEAAASSSPASRQLSVTPVNDPPVISLPGAGASFTENGAAVVIDGTATASDVDSLNFNGGSLTVDYAANGTADDVLSIRNQGTAAGQIGTSSNNVRYSGTNIGTFAGGAGTTPLVITFNSSAATPAAIQALMRNIMFDNVSGQPSESARSVRFVLSDGDGGTSNAATQTVTVIGVNTAPIVDLNGNSTGTGYSATFTENGSPVAIVSTNNLSVTDPDNATLAYATVTIRNRLDGTAESLTATDTDTGITTGDITYDSVNGILRIQPAAPAAKNSFRTVLRSVKYNNSSESPNATSRLIDFVLNDGEDSGPAATSTVTIVPVNDAPVLTPGSPAMNTIDEDALDNLGMAVSAIFGATISDADLSDPVGVALTATNPGNGTWQYQLAGETAWTDVGSVSTSSALLLRATDRLRFRPDGRNATTAGFSYYAWDQSNGAAAGSLVDPALRGGTAAFSEASDTANLSVSAVNDAPVLDTSASPSLSAILEDATNPTGDSVAAILVDGSITDVDLPGPASEALALTAVEASNGTWQYSLDGGLTWNPVLSVSESDALLLAAASYLRFVPAADFNGAASLTFRAWDGFSGSIGGRLDTSSNGGTSAFSSASDTASITVGAVNDAPSFTPGSDVSVAEDAGPQDLPWATAISAGPANEADQVLSFQLENDYSALFSAGPVLDPTTGDLTFTPASDRFGAATVTVVLRDDGGTLNGGVDQSVAVVFRLAITPVNDPPVVTTSAGSASYTENDPALAVDPSLTLEDVDSPELSGATVQITGNYVKGQDTLAFTNASGITGVWDAATGVLTLSGSASLAEYQAALRSVTYVNLSDNPSPLDRTLEFVVTDGDDSSTPATRQLNVTPVNDPPIATDDTAATLVDTAVDIDVLVNDTDAESDVLTVDSVTVPSHGEATTNGTQVNYTPTTGYIGTDSFTYTVSDVHGGSSTVTVAVIVGAGAGPASLTLTGPEAGTAGVTYAFAASVDAATTLPITYTWQPSDQPEETQALVASQMSLRSFQWGTPGDHTVTITATNAFGSISRTHQIQIAEPLTMLRLRDSRAAATGPYRVFRALDR